MLDSEANLQAEFYHQCKLIGQQCALEVTTRVGRLDIAVLSADRCRILAIVEAKKSHAYFANGQSAQIQRYKLLGLPVYGLSPSVCPERLAKTIQAKHGSDQGIALPFAAGIKLFVPTPINPRNRLHRKMRREYDPDLNVKAS